MKKGIVLSGFVCVAILAGAQQQDFNGKSWWRHIEVLAADKMEGRGTGTPGLERAEAYVVDQLKRVGVGPAGTTGYYQPIEFETREFVAADTSAALVRDGKVEPLVLGADAVFVKIPNPAPRVEAPLVFLGYGLRIPEKGYDDLAGLDLKGKVAVTILGLPEGITGPLAYHSRRSSERWEQFRKAGLIGWIDIPISDTAWRFIAADWLQPIPSLAGNEFDDARGGQILMEFNPARADKLLHNSGHTSAKLFTLASAHKPLPHFDLPATFRAQTRMLKKPFKSANIVAKLEGSDPKLKNEYVVFTAHIDGQGIGEPVNGDAIYNSAVDNASGCAALLDIAAVLRKDYAPRRSILFVFFTAEEPGVLGSRYFAAHPTVDPNSMVANINLDGIHAIVPLKEVRVLGLDESDLGEAARRVGASLNIPVDPEAALNPYAFIGSSDQYSFIVRGIPALVLKVGFPGELSAVLEKHRRSVHHTPFDDLHQRVNLETAGRLEEFVLRVLLDVANDPRRPQWKSSSFYKRYAL